MFRVSFFLVIPILVLCVEERKRERESERDRRFLCQTFPKHRVKPSAEYNPRPSVG